MLEAVAAGCRALACEPNLLVLHALCPDVELSSAKLALRAMLPAPQVSGRLGVLAARGVVQRRRSGAHVYYRLVDQDGGQRRFWPWGLVRGTLADPSAAAAGWEHGRTLHLSPGTLKKVPAGVATAMDIIFDAATAFANVRRLQIVKLLQQKSGCSTVEVQRTLKMSPPACWRHLGKLKRRGYAREEPPGTWVLVAHPKARFHRGLLNQVLEALG